MFLELRKVLTAIAKQKGCEILTEWIRPCENHLYWSATTTMCGTGRIIWAKFKSFLSHIVNKHENLDDPLFNKCGHGSNISHRKWFLPGKHSGFGFYKVQMIYCHLVIVQIYSNVTKNKL